MRRLMLCAMLGFAAVLPAQPPLPASVAIERVTVIDVATGRRVPNQTVLLAGERIVRVGAADSLTVPAEALRLDGRGKFLIPGLWDMHVHASRPGRAERYFLLYIAHGVTGVRDMGPTPEFADSSMVWSARSARHAVIGPRLVPSTPILDGYVGADDRSKIALTTPADARRVVDSLAAMGAQTIKAYSLLRPEVSRALVEASHARGVPVAGHASFLLGVQESAAIGMRSLEHLMEFDVACSAKADSLTAAARAEYLSAPSARGALALAIAERGYPLVAETFDAERCEALGRFLRANNTWVTPTLAHRLTVINRLWLDSVPGRAEVRRWLPAAEQRDWDRAAAAGGFPNRVSALKRNEGPLQVPIIRALHAGGVRWLAGTDIGEGAGREHSAPGVALHDELGALVMAGLSPAEALRAATMEPAAYLGRDRELGQVLPGMEADLVLLDADPLESIDHTRRIHTVVARGRVYGPEAIRALLARVEQLARAAGTSP